MSYLKTVVHLHTHYSHDSNRSPAELIELAAQRCVDCVAVTDHDEIAGAFEAADIARTLTAGRVRVIIGEEISTSDGHLLGLFLKNRIEPGLPAIVTAQRIRQQGGLVFVPHPFATLAGDALGDTVNDLLPWIDAVEVCNAQNPLWWQCGRAADFARQHDLPAFVGSDAHLRGTLDRCHQLMPAFNPGHPQSFLNSLRRATLVPGRFGPLYIAQMAVQDVWMRLFGRPCPGFGQNCTPTAAAVHAR